MFGGKTAQVVELGLFHLDEEVVALVASPRQIGLGRPYALLKSCGECVHAAPPRPGSWVDGTGVCRFGRGDHVSNWVPSAALPGGDGAGHPRPLCGKRFVVPLGVMAHAERDRGV
ncbi:hypothetical protein STRTUCAR8_08107 [Streptomyces turgidiscabies Car8]|uniref:Uncharacterized protein n=1 Tax=Streptomyces turgidiscabies (strain Car8) TaxID=698760 RepID=L7EZL1_STRT8|nr:hypothetical protein STRTUCAR8_08107 [Streptomyces turgidiscabies Car8]